MKLFNYFVAIYFACQLSGTAYGKMICYYDTAGAIREGYAKFTAKDMETTLQFCSYVIYSYVTITPKTFVISSLTHQQHQEFLNMSKYKTKYPNVKFLLSLSGRTNFADTENFLELLDADHKAQQAFVNSVVQVTRKYKFDGLSLDLQLPTEKPKQVHPYYAKIWFGITSLFTSNSEDDAKTLEHKRELTDLIQQLRSALRGNNEMLSLTVLPNVKSKAYFDTSAITKNLDFIILSAFDFYTPLRNPEEADYMAPIDAPIKKGNRLAQANVKKLVTEWTTQFQVPREKIILGVAAYGRSWKMTNSSKTSGLPPVLATNGSAPAGPMTHMPGFLSYPEICTQFSKVKTSNANPFLRVVDPTKKYGNYAYRIADNHGNPGEWISYEDPLTTGDKTEYAKSESLGGVALFDITLDDLRGHCNGETFPILRSIVRKLLQ